MIYIIIAVIVAIAVGAYFVFRAKPTIVSTVKIAAREEMPPATPGPIQQQNSDIYGRLVSSQDIDDVHCCYTVSSNGVAQFTITMPKSATQDQVYSTIQAMAPADTNE